MPPMQVIINDDEEVTVDSDADDFFITRVESVNDVAAKCAKCEGVTIQSGIEFVVTDVNDNRTPHRFYCCGTCGTVRRK